MKNRFDADDAEMEKQNQIAEGLSFDVYEENPCPNCNRIRLGKRKNGRTICEKCHWCVDTNSYDSESLSRF